MELIGHKNTAIFDLWSLCHFLAGVALGNIIPKLLSNKTTCNDDNYETKTEMTAVILLISLAYSWELLEFFLETGGAGQRISYWLQGREYYLNRLLSDPLLLLFGYFSGRKFRRFVWPARVLLFAWLWLFVFVYPHSMAYLLYN